MLGDALEIIILEGIFAFDIDRKFSFNKLLANFKVFFLLTWYYLYSRDDTKYHRLWKAYFQLIEFFNIFFFQI